MIKQIMLNHLPFGIVKIIRKIRGRSLKIFARSKVIAGISTKVGLLRIKYFDDTVDVSKYNLQNLNWANSFGEYSRKSDRESINVLWVDGPCPGNFGDWLSPYLFAKLTSKNIKHIDDFESPNSDHIIGVGSIAVLANKKSKVLGSGVAFANDKLNPNSRYFFVRGPYTLQRVISCGGSVENSVMGDLGYLLSILYEPKSKKNSKGVLFVRHNSHRNLDIKLPENFREISVAVASSNDIENFIDELYSSEFVVTSAMHCYIACKSYGIPCALVRFENEIYKIYGDGIKYLDAMEGVGLPSYLPNVISCDLNIVNFNNILDRNLVDKKVIKNLYDLALKSIK